MPVCCQGWWRIVGSFLALFILTRDPPSSPQQRGHLKKYQLCFDSTPWLLLLDDRHIISGTYPLTAHSSLHWQLLVVYSEWIPKHQLTMYQKVGRSLSIGLLAKYKLIRPVVQSLINYATLFIVDPSSLTPKNISRQARAWMHFWKRKASFFRSGLPWEAYVTSLMCGRTRFS